jgi:hypothetical protein
MKMSAKSAWSKYRSASAGGPNQATHPPGASSSSWSQTCRLATLWVTTTTVRPSSASDRSVRMTERSIPGSRPEVGSSRNSRDGLTSSSRATLVRLRCPPERLVIVWSACAVRPSSPSTSSTRCWRSASVVSAGNRSRAE